MKKQIKVTLQRSPNYVDHKAYKLTKMVGSVLLVGYGKGEMKDYHVGAWLSEQDAIALAAYKHIEVTVV